MAWAKADNHWFGKITRRLFLVFLLFALVPTTVLTFLVFRFVSAESTTQMNRLQDEQAGALVDSILDRLTVMNERLSLVARELVLETPTPMISEVMRGDYAFKLLDRTLLDTATGMREPTETVALLRGGGALLMQAGIAPQESHVYLARAISPANLDAGLLAVELDEHAVLGDPDAWDQRLVSCVYDEQAQLLFATRAEVCRAFAGFDTYQDSYRGLARQTIAGVDYLAGYRSMFLGSVFAAHDWRVLVTRPSAELLSASLEFKKMFFALALLVVLSISLVTIFLIRRQMSPLGPIMAGIQRVAQKDYGTAVEVNSGDEFEDLAHAFNSMSERVSHQLVTQASMSEIDQLILSRVKKEDIVRIVLEQTRAILPADNIAMILLNGDVHATELYRLDESGEMVQAAVEIEPDWCQQLLLNDYLLLQGVDARAPSYLRASGISSRCFFQSIPVRQDGSLVAVLVLTFDQQPAFTADDVVLARTYSDRIAVALAHAEWEQRLYHQAHYDGLTGLPNRLSFLDRLGQSITRAQRQHETMAILFIDLDNFKLVNDSLGHPVGDRFIQLVAERFEECLRADDSVARLGGDEFVITAVGNEDHELTVSSISRVANRILEAAARPLDIEGHEIRASASIGIAIYPRDGVDPESLLKNADTAMYHAKSQGRGKFQFFSSELNDQLVELMRLSTDIRQALERNEFQLHYQPKVDAATRRIVGAEALVRWNHPQRGLVSPDVFIQAAEGLGLIGAIGDWTLEAACRQQQQWQESGMETVRVAINVSAIQLQQDDMYAKVKQLLEQYGLRGEDIEVEITENSLIHDMESTVEILNRLRSLGVEVSIDDYGTGYSSLSYMKEMPVNTLKIDRCFITNLLDDSADQAIVSSTIVLARKLGMKVLAEGVETVQQLEVLQAYGCDEIQGFLFSRGVNARDFAHLLLEEQPFSLPVAARILPA